MCGRFALDVDLDEIIRVFGLTAVTENYQRRHNIAPSQYVPIIRIYNDKRTLDSFRWGLVPFWTKKLEGSVKLINARAESIEEKPSFRQPFRKQRCLVPASCFYEWRNEGRKKIPYSFSLPSQKLFAFAGIWDDWLSANNERLYSFSIITTAANKQMLEYHDRMPVILDKSSDQGLWLESESPLSLQNLLKPFEGLLTINQAENL